MATRHPLAHVADGLPRRRRAFRWLVGLAALSAAAWFSPNVAVLTPVRDWPLQRAFAGIDGAISSRSASWNWFGGIDYRDVILADRSGRPVAAARRMVVDRGLFQLVIDRADLGTVRLVGGEALVEVRRGGSGLEDVVAPWLAASARAAAAPSFELEIVDATVEMVDVERRDAWRITELVAAGSLRPGATLAGWTIAGRVVHTGTPKRDLAAAFASPLPGPAAPPSDDPQASLRLDRTTIVTGATTTLARAGGWSVSSPADTGQGSPRTVAVAGNRVPLDLSRIVATRFDVPRVLDGVADLRLDIQLPTAAPATAGLRVAGSITGNQLALCRADTLLPLVSLERCEAPVDLSIDGSTVTLRDFRLISPLFRADVSGRIGLPQGTWWEWAELLIGDDFALAADVDLAAAARSVTGGLQVRPDVRVTGGQLQLAAAARSEGTQRVLEARLASRDLEVVQGERQLRWAEPFVGWLRSRRGAGRGERMRVEEARLSSSAFEISASGNSEASDLQWTADLGRLLADAGEVLDLDGMELAGTTRGRLSLERAPATGAATTTLNGSVSGLRWIGVGRPDWIDEEISLDARAEGSVAGGTAVIDMARGECVAGDDRLEASLGGGAILDPATIPSLLGIAPRAGPWLRSAPTSGGVNADVSLRGDLGRWQARLAAFGGALALPGTRLGGAVQASAALAAHGDAWQVTRAGAEIEKLVVDDGRIAEPRLVATAAGTINTASGRVDISSAEVLTATMSLRTGGLAILDTAGSAAAPWSVLERVRGRAQWQVDVGRVESWCLGEAVAGHWPASGRMWGTVDLQDTPAGLNLLVDATGNQLTLGEVGNDPAAGILPVGLPGGSAREVWAEPRARLMVEITRAPVGDTLAVNRLAIESSTVAASAAGSIVDWSSRPRLDIGGTLTYDWGLLSRLLLPWTGGRIELAGGAARPFVFRGPVEPLARLVAGRFTGRPLAPTSAEGNEPRTVEVPLPDSWLATIRGPGREADPERPLRAALPVSLQPGLRAPSPDWLRSLSIDTSTAWSAGTWDGVRIDAGEMPLRLFEGQLALGPFDVGLGGGRIRGTPWVQLLPLPGEFVIPPGRLADRVVLAGPVAERFMTWIFPLLGRSTRTQGLVSVDVGGARLPLNDPWAGEAAGQLVFENLEVQPGPLLAPLANLLVKLQSVIDPRFAFGDKAVLLRVRPDPVRVRVTGRRTWHDGLLMDMGQLAVRSAGSVGADGSLAMVVEVGFRGDLVAGAPRLAKLMRSPLVIPLKGTVERPQFDVGAIDLLIQRIVDNTAEAVIKDGFEQGLEGLEELFGNPPPRLPTPPPGSAPAAPPAAGGPGLSFPGAPAG